jgi:hypothetical protein
MYAVRQGDYLAKIAKDHGLGKWQRAVWIAEVIVQLGIERQLNVSSHLLALVPGQAPP